jgi:5-bromo-4-chloroindolyl phosphate hydrolysis protein
MPNISATGRAEESSVHNLTPLKDTLTEADIRYITSNLSNAARTEFIKLAKLSQYASQIQDRSLAEAVDRQIRVFFEREDRIKAVSRSHALDVEEGTPKAQGPSND